jgi:hypothetical protein
MQHLNEPTATSYKPKPVFERVPSLKQYTTERSPPMSTFAKEMNNFPGPGKYKEGETFKQRKPCGKIQPLHKLDPSNKLPYVPHTYKVNHSLVERK